MSNNQLLRKNPRGTRGNPLGWSESEWDAYRADNIQWERELLAARDAIAAAFGVEPTFRRSAAKWIARVASERGYTLEQAVEWVRNIPDDELLTSKERNDIRCLLGESPNKTAKDKAAKAVEHFRQKLAEAERRLNSLGG